jgi:hypothetical protein
MWGSVTPSSQKVVGALKKFSEKSEKIGGKIG